MSALADPSASNGLGAAGWIFLCAVFVLPRVAGSIGVHSGGIEGPVTMRRAVIPWIVALVPELVLAWIAMRSERLEFWREFGADARSIRLAAFTLAAFLVVGWYGFRVALRNGKHRLFDWAPRNRRDLREWWVAALLLGIGCELVYRGALFAILLKATGAESTAWLLASIAFGVAQVRQGAGAVLTVTLFGLQLQLLANLSGSLHLSIAVAYNALYGTIVGRELARSRA
ncbi:MAG: CPBP family intramembrane metalloprotease [Planctomycetes bacterium]|nr:CPBP family intramembrane metalloprotease [Planctomycetota bacterium]